VWDSDPLALVAPDGEAREVADELAFPNGMVLTPDNRTLIVAESFAGRLTAFDIDDDGSLSSRRTWADGIAPDGICVDADGCIWASTAHDANDCARVPEGGEALERIQLDRPCFASMLGGPDRHAVHARRPLAWPRERRRPRRCADGPGPRCRRASTRNRLAVRVGRSRGRSAQTDAGWVTACRREKYCHNGGMAFPHHHGVGLRRGPTRR
jgi:hypothetical protein